MNYKKYGKVKLGKGIKVEDYVVIGMPAKSGARPTTIGENSVLRTHTVIYSGNIIGKNFQTGHATMVREDNKIGDNVSIGSHSIVEHHTVIEDNVRIHSGAFVPEYSILRRGCWIGPRAVLTNTRYPLSKRAKETLEGPDIGEGAIIGANATILPGVKIGRNAFIGAGSVVTKDVPEDTIVVGCPAAPVGKRSELRYRDTGQKAY